MKKKERTKWLDLCAWYFEQNDLRGNSDGTFKSLKSILCGWCRYQEWEEEPGDFGSVLARYPVCWHPFDSVAEGNNILSDDWDMGTDCWAFSPKIGWRKALQSLSVEKAQVLGARIRINDVLAQLYEEEVLNL
jgi:hypothetical protein